MSESVREEQLSNKSTEGEKKDAKEAEGRCGANRDDRGRERSESSSSNVVVVRETFQRGGIDEIEGGDVLRFSPVCTSCTKTSLKQTP